ncbi:hypothetical protein SNOG_08525 [Parastagonospora nodorum SN15]|uniref:Uncharacterized protein n=1 Tax=Phaeosphaeria nodorum (strain SN15 / ATCC MYA-4574 / FGSC 10173) TaxID=321614 RepID=Q0UI89_PHANO|nr:hypothetical protein SNOG_08525 [Parastagonospora nodorum SN15]EAT83693.1 hypothetical protein SNOG_08525 [Parastagonospora nodorum SN15]
MTSIVAAIQISGAVAGSRPMVAQTSFVASVGRNYGTVLEITYLSHAVIYAFSDEVPDSPRVPSGACGLALKVYGSRRQKLVVQGRQLPIPSARNICWTLAAVPAFQPPITLLNLPV